MMSLNPHGPAFQSINDMYAIIRDGSRQYKVQAGQELDIDYREAAAGEAITFCDVLCIAGGDEVKIGKPLLEGVSVAAEVVGVNQGPKIVVQKFRRRKNSRRRTGHRQLYTRVKIGKIEA